MSIANPPSLGEPGALRWLIRGAGVLLMAWSGFYLFCFGVTVVLALLGVGTGLAKSLDKWEIFCGLLLFTTFAGFFGLIFKVGYDMVRKVTIAALSNFAFVFAVLMARAAYYSAPVIAGRLGGKAIAPMAGTSEHALTYRGSASFLVFIVFYFLVKEYLRQAFDLDQSGAPPNPELPDPSIPAYPQKSPLIEL